VSRGHIQRVRRDVVQQLQCGLRVPGWIDIVDTSSGHVPIRHL
jgi:hypothetical protein